MTSQRTFQVRAKQKASPANDLPPIDYTFVTDSPFEGGEPIERVIHAFWPGDGAMTLLFSVSSEDGQEALQSIMNIFRQSLSIKDYAYLRKLLSSDEIDEGVLIEMLEDMIEVWSGFPTQSPSASTPSPQPSGGRSTGRARPAASTP